MDTEVRVQLSRDSPTVTLVGEVDIASADRLRGILISLAATSNGVVELDLSQVAFMDSTGLGAIVASGKALAQVGVRLVLSRPSPIVARLLEIVNLRAAMEIRP